MTRPANHSQATHYTIEWPARKRQRRDSPFRPLVGESALDAAHRYTLYERVWAHQLAAIERILNCANTQLFAHLLRYLRGGVSPKLDVAFLGLSSNTANNVRILDEFDAYVAASAECAHVRIVRLTSKTCHNIKVAVREVVKQVLEGPTRDISAEEDVKQEDSDEDVEDEDEVEGDGGRISYDLEIVEDWVDAYKKRTRCGDRLRIAIFLDDSNGFANDVINQLVQVFCVHSQRTPIKLVMCLSTKNATDWVNRNLTSKLRNSIEGARLEAKDNRDIGYQVIDDILLQNEITATNPLLLDAQLSLIILSRFENSNNSIDSLITELKLSYMIHFYQLPLAALVDPDYVPKAFHNVALRRLPSFKTHIEYLLHLYTEQDDASQKQTIIDLLEDDDMLHKLLLKAKMTFQEYQNCVMNAVNIAHYLGRGKKHKFQIYKLVTNNQLVNSVFLSDLLKAVKNFTQLEIDEFTAFISGPVIKESLASCTDEYVQKLKAQVQALERSPEASSSLVTYITDYLHSNKNLNMKISDNLFNEVLTINGGSSELDELKPRVSIEENYRNLMINLIRPQQREVIEGGLDEPQRYLNNALVAAKVDSDTSRLVGPALSKLHHIYKDAPVNINLHDFHIAFKQTLHRGEVIKELRLGLAGSQDQKLFSLVDQMETDEHVWDKVVYAWFVQSCFELHFLGFVKEKSKGDYVEKMIWKNL